METGAEHPLRQWRLRREWTLDAAAAAVGTVRQVWYDWETGRRIPQRESMREIYRLTRGAVAPNDFYDLPPIGQLDLPLASPPAAPLFDQAADAPRLQAVA